MEPVTDVVAASSSASDTPAAAAPAASDTPKRALSDLSADERRAWRKTGTIPDAPAASSTASAVEDPPAGTPATSDTASEPSHDDPDYKPKTAKRIAELLAENKRLRESAAAPPKPAARPASAPAVAPPALVKPNPETFTYGTADPDYLEALADFKVESKLRSERAALAEATRKQHDEDALADTNRSWTERRTAAEAKYPDFAAVALKDFTPGFDIKPGSLIDAWILESEHGADVLYALMKNPAEIRRIDSLKPHQQARELAKVEERALQPLKTQTSAPDPGPTLGVRAGDPASPAMRAAKKGDAASYIREKNREELAARKGH